MLFICRGARRRSDTVDMPRSITGVWRDDRTYEALIPAPVADLAPVGEFATAEAALIELDAAVSVHPRRRKLVDSLLYAESLSSALVMRLALGTDPQLGEAPHRGMAAFRRAVAAGVAREFLDEAALAELHRMLTPELCAVHGHACGGRLRRAVVWTRGGHPADAAYVAPARRAGTRPARAASSPL